MDYFEFSIRMEKDAEALYRSIAERVSSPGTSKVLQLLAEDEVRHRKNIELLRNKTKMTEFEGSALKIKTVFEEMKANIESEQNQKDLIDEYRKALEIETKGIEYYKQQFENITDENSKKLFRLLMRQETYHRKTIANLIEMIEKPAWWVENAEFNPEGDSYY